MPLYEYECTACHRRTEKIQKFSDAELTECPFCGQRLERTLTAPAVHFSGGGWYKDLYSSAKPAASGSSEGGSGEGGSGEAGSGATKAGAPESAPAGNSNSGGEKSAGSAAPAAGAPAAAAAPAASTPKSGS